MDFKPVTGRARADLAIRVVFTGVILVLGVAAITERDARAGAATVVIASFAVLQFFVLPAKVERAVNILLWVGVAAWISFVIA